jgi:hypothetical protein
VCVVINDTQSISAIIKKALEVSERQFVSSNRQMRYESGGVRDEQDHKCDVSRKVDQTARPGPR